MSEKEWVEKYYEYYNKHSLPIKHMEKIEKVLTENAESDPIGFRRFVRFLEAIETMTEVDKWGRDVKTPHNISQGALDLLINYCVIYPEELPCLLADIVMKNEIGKMKEICRRFNEIWREKLKSWDKGDRALMYYLIETEEESDDLLLKKRLQLNDEFLKRNLEETEEAVQEYMEKMEKNDAPFFKLTNKSEEIMLEVKILTYICRKSPVEVKNILRVYNVNKGWITQKIRKWKKERYISVKNKPLTLVKNEGLKAHLMVYMKSTLADTHHIVKNGEIHELSEEVVEFYDRLDEIVRHEGKL